MHPWLDRLEFPDGRFLPGRILPGPMEGVSEGSFVKVMSMRGLASSWFTPFIRVSNGVPRMARLREKLAPYIETGLPVVAQIMGCHSELLAETASRLHRLGAVCVDLNCGCPSATVLGSHSGGYHLREPEWMLETLRAMKEACGSGGVSVKIRCGFSSPSEIDEIAAALREARPHMVTCHFRTVRELYRPVPGGVLRLARMRELLPGIPLVGSGDLFSVDDARRMYEETGVDGVAPARGLMRNPLLLKEIEAYCRGEEADPGLNRRQLVEFLDQVGRMSGHRRREQGFVLKIAREMFGEESAEFQALLADIARG